MTTLNAAPTAMSTAPTGTAGTAAAPVRTPVPLPVTTTPRPAPDTAHEPKAPEIHLLGSGTDAASGATGVTPRPGSVKVPLDQFAKQSGPDASVQTATGIVSVHAVFQLDQKTRELSVAIVSDDGHLIRMIPPKSVARMIAAMATYRGR